VKSSTAGVVADSVAVTGSFIPIVGGIPATIVGGSVAILRLLAEQNLDSELREKLEKIAEDYRSSHPTIIEHHAAFKELHETLKSHYSQAVIEKEKAEKAFMDATNAYERTQDEGSHRQLSEAATALHSAEIALQDLSKHLEGYERNKANFDAYAEALLLIHDLEPKETPVDERELGSVSASRLSTYAGTESLEFSPASEFSSDYVTKSSVGVSKTQRALQEIGITPGPSQKPKTSKTEKEPAPLKKDSEKEPMDIVKLSQLMTYGVEGFYMT
jgi:predicted transcriptional regulator